MEAWYIRYYFWDTLIDTIVLKTVDELRLNHLFNLL